jgi:hypothetical protein
MATLRDRLGATRPVRVMRVVALALLLLSCILAGLALGGLVADTAAFGRVHNVLLWGGALLALASAAMQRSHEKNAESRQQ